MPELSWNASEGFPVTQWEMIEAASQPGLQEKQVALERVLTRYMPALKVHLLSQFRVSEDQAADWLQNFILNKVLKRNLIAYADRRRGKFRTFLLSSLDNFVIQEMRKEKAGKRSPTEPPVSLDDITDHTAIKCEEHHTQAFDLAWAREVLAETLRRMQRQCEESQRSDLWGVLEGRILKPLLEEAKPLSYEDLVTQFGLQSPTQASNVLITAKRMFSRVLRSVVAEYARNEHEIEEEIKDLKAILFHG